MRVKQSLFDFVQYHIDEDGFFTKDELPDLENYTRNSEVRWPLGGKESLRITSAISHQTDTAREVLNLFMHQIANPGNENKKALYMKVRGEFCVFYVWDFIEMLCRQTDLSDDALFDTAFWLFTESKHPEPAKLGIALLSFYSIENIPVSYTDKLSDWLLEMGKCSEFTDYVISMFTLNSRKANEHIFHLARKTRGWGRVFAVRALKPETQEIKEWLIEEACRDVSYSEYMALDCFHKGELEKMMKADTIKPLMYEGASQILMDLMENQNYVKNKNYRDVLVDFLRHSVSHCCTLPQYHHVLVVKDFLFGTSEALYSMFPKVDRSEIALESLQRIKNAWNWELKMNWGLKDEDPYVKHCAIQYAKRQNLDVGDVLYQDLKAHPESTQLYGELMTTTDRTRFLRLVELAESDSGRFINDFITPVSFFKELANYPYVGQALVEAALKSPIDMHCQAALEVVMAWGAQYIPSSIKVALEAGLKKTNNVRNRRRIMALLIDYASEEGISSRFGDD